MTVHPTRAGWLFCAVVLFCAAKLSAQPADPSFWQRQNIYQLITDRFYNGDPKNDNLEGTFDPAGHRGTSVHGGDFKGIEQKLDYLQALGATAIWISPIVLNVRGEFHGYAGLDFYKIAPHWGTLDDLRHLVAAAHAHGILVIDDVVVNHGGNLVDSGDPGYAHFKRPPDGYHLRFHNPSRTYPPPFDLNPTNSTPESLFHNQGATQDFSDRTQVELGELFGLDDFRTESPYIRQRMAEIYQYWIEQAGFDAFRVDTVKHVEQGFWQTWCPAIHDFAHKHGRPNFFIFGEVMEGLDSRCGEYTGRKAGASYELDSVLDYPLYFRVNSVFASATAAPRELADRFDGLAGNYAPLAQKQLVTFLDNHDQPRFLSSDRAKGDISRLETALVFLYTSVGIPALYYGTEQGFNGRNDPFDREDMFAGQFEQGPSIGDNFDMTHPLFQWVAKLNNLRRLYPALTLGSQSNLWSDASGPGLFAYTRQSGKDRILVILNTAGQTRTLTNCALHARAKTRFVNLLKEDEAFDLGVDGRTPSLEIPGNSAKIFAAAKTFRPLSPAITRVSPAHDAKGVLPSAPLSLEFSQPMNHASVEAAFRTSPKVPGEVTWTKGPERMVFQPGDSGWPTNTLITVRVETGARAQAHRLHLTGAFEARFLTASP